MSKFYVMNEVVYCDDHKPTSKLAEKQMVELRVPQRSDRCHVCGDRP